MGKFGDVTVSGLLRHGGDGSDFALALAALIHGVGGKVRISVLCGRHATSTSALNGRRSARRARSRSRRRRCVAASESFAGELRAPASRWRGGGTHLTSAASTPALAGVGRAGAHVASRGAGAAFDFIATTRWTARAPLGTTLLVRRRTRRHPLFTADVRRHRRRARRPRHVARLAGARGGSRTASAWDETTFAVDVRGHAAVYLSVCA